MNGRLQTIALILLGAVLTVLASAAPPPDRINYQGVLRDAGDRPLDGDHDMVFRFMSADVGGDEILVDEHDAAHANPVTVSNGLFNVELGGGAVSDGSGPGSYTSLATVFRDYASVWLQLEVGGEALDPRVRVISAAYALNADYLDGINSTAMLRSNTSDSFTSGTLSMNGSTTLDVNGTLRMDGPVTKATSDLVTNLNADLLDGLHSSAFAGSVHGHPGSDITSPVDEAVNADTVDGKHAAEFINTSAAAQTKAGPLTLDASAAVAFGIEASGQSGGGHFEDSNSSGYARAAWGDFGMYARGSQYGAKFEDSDDTGYAYLGYENHGVSAGGSVMGGRFEDTNSTGLAFIAYGHYGVEAEGGNAGGYFKDNGDSGYAYLGSGDVGISAYGELWGGHFEDSDSSGWARVAISDFGIQAEGNAMGGQFADSDDSGVAYVGYGDIGIEARGALEGGHFYDTDNSGYARIAYHDYGVSAGGNSGGGRFEDHGDSGYALVGVDHFGIRGFGNTAGGYFQDLNSTGYANVAHGDRGIWAKGTFAGGTFSHPDNVTFWADVSTSAHKIVGTGAVSFVQNHPYEEDKVIVYAAPEGDEVAVYTRGTARLIAGEAHVRLGETFQYVANPDIGLTAHLTARGDDPVPLSVASLTTTEMTVYGPDASDATFDYLVYGLRLGFEELSIVRQKEKDALLPTTEAIEEDYAGHPELRFFNAMERYSNMHAEVFPESQIDLSRSRTLVAALESQRLAAIARATTQEESISDDAGGIEGSEGTPDAQDPLGADALAQRERAIPDTLIVDSDPEETALPAGVTMPVSVPVETGDVLVFDIERPGMLRPVAAMADTTVAGIAVGESWSEGELGEEEQLQVQVALTGLVECKVDAGYGAVRVGDLLTTSPTPGHAMRALEPLPGTILGKAAETLEAGTGTIRVLVMPQ